MSKTKITLLVFQACLAHIFSIFFVINEALSANIEVATRANSPRIEEYEKSRQASDAGFLIELVIF